MSDYEIGLEYMGNGLFKAYTPLMSEECDKEFDLHQVIIVSVQNHKEQKIRTILQNKSLHLYLNKVSELLISQGVDMRYVLEKMKTGFYFSPTMPVLKECVWKPIQKALTGKESTTKLDTKEVSEIYEHMNRFTAENFGIGVPFPDRYSQSMENYDHANDHR